MRKSSNKLISFSIEGEDSQFIVGFKIMSAETAKKFMKAVKLLEEHEADMIVNGVPNTYSSEYYSVSSVSQSEINVLEKTIGLEIEDFTSNIVGIFPDALADAYDTGIMSEGEEEEEDIENEDDEDDLY